MNVKALCPYLRDTLVVPLAKELQAQGAEVHLWAVEEWKPEVVTLTRGFGRAGKFVLINRLSSYLADAEYVLLFDDDIRIPPNFCVEMLQSMQAFGMEIAQPALTVNSYHSHNITLQRTDTWVRFTNFVESGPVVMFTRHAFDYLIPFESQNTMGWGFDVEWSKIAADRGWPIGVVDTCPIEHTYRPVNATYSRKGARRDMREYLRQKNLAFPPPTVLSNYKR